MKDSPRGLAAAALYRVNQEGAYSNLVLDSLLSSHELAARDKGLVSALFYGCLERKITLDYIIASYSKTALNQIEPFVLEFLRIGLYQLLYMDKIPHAAAVNESVALAKKSGHGQAAGYVNGVLRAVERNLGKLVFPPEKNRLTYLSIRYACPKWLIKLWDREYGKQLCEEMLPCLLGRPPLTVRSNPLACRLEELSDSLSREGIQTKEISWLPDSLEIGSTGGIENTEPYQKGWFHVQDLSSQLCCFLLGARPGERVLDVCAAPGGKTFTLAEMMENQGELLSFDLHEQRVRLIQEGASRLGLRNVRAAQRDALEESVDFQADRILCDVPCSGFGILRRKPEIRQKDPHILDNLPELQYRILYRSSQMLRPGGILFYSTCTLNPSENERVVSRFLEEKKEEFEPYFLDLPPEILRAREEPAHQLTIFPQMCGTDGFFIAGLRKKMG